jgi:hypothetical protein
MPIGAADHDVSANEVVEKPLQDIAPVMHMLQDFDIEIFRSEMRDGPL